MTTTSAPPLPMVLGQVEVVAAERLSPSFVRVQFGGPALADVGVDGPLLDQRIKIIFPNAIGDLPRIAPHAGWYADWLALPDHERGHMRTYTIRDLHGSGADTRLTVDFVLHTAPGHTGPGSAWAALARPGDRVIISAPRRGVAYGGIEFHPHALSDLLLVADETAVPALAGILRDLHPGARGIAFAEVPQGDDVQPLRGRKGVRLVWLPRDGQPRGSRIIRAVRHHFGLSALGGVADHQPDGVELWETPTYSSTGQPLGDELAEPGRIGETYAWIAGESGMVTDLRRTLIGQLGLARGQVAFMGYWRQGVAMKG